MIKWWLVIISPFVLLAFVQSLKSSFRFTVLNPPCFKNAEALADYWTAYSILEAGSILASVLMLSHIRREYNIQAMRFEFIIAFVVSFLSSCGESCRVVLNY
jgi:hypothetical protein